MTEQCEIVHSRKNMCDRIALFIDQSAELSLDIADQYIVIIVIVYCSTPLRSFFFRT